MNFKALRPARAIQIDRKILLLLILIACEVFATVHIWHKSGPRVPYAFLVKNGDLYQLFWKTEGKYDSASYTSLHQALQFAYSKLDLEEGHNPYMTDDLERIWMQDRSGAYVMFWKTLKLEHLNQMTFHRRAELDFYMRAFRSGNYTTSPFGHSIFLRAASVE